MLPEALLPCFASCEFTEVQQQCLSGTCGHSEHSLVLPQLQRALICAFLTGRGGYCIRLMFSAQWWDFIVLTRQLLSFLSTGSTDWTLLYLCEAGPNSEQFKGNVFMVTWFKAITLILTQSPWFMQTPISFLNCVFPVGSAVWRESLSAVFAFLVE